MGQHLVTAAVILGSMICTVLANLSLKIGAQRPGVLAGWPSVINMHVIVAAGWFALAFLLYALVLRRLPLSLAQAIFSVQFVLVILAANLVLNEGIGGMRWLGIALMAAGLLVVCLSPEGSPIAAAADQVAEQRRP